MKLKAKKKSRSFSFVLSDLDYNHFQELAKRQKMIPAEYLRTLIQVTWLANNTEDLLKGETLEIGGYGVTFPPYFIEKFAKKLETAFADFDWNELEENVKITGNRHYRPK
jgi:hypothetical protein